MTTSVATGSKDNCFEFANTLGSDEGVETKIVEFPAMLARKVGDRVNCAAFTRKSTGALPKLMAWPMKGRDKVGHRGGRFGCSFLKKNKLKAGIAMRARTSIWFGVVVSSSINVDVVVSNSIIAEVSLQRCFAKVAFKKRIPMRDN